jgi:hypothetical protein
MYIAFPYIALFLTILIPCFIYSMYRIISENKNGETVLECGCRRVNSKGCVIYYQQSVQDLRDEVKRANAT